MTGVYIYIKHGSIPYDFYNVVGSYVFLGSLLGNLIDNPVIYYNGQYYALIYTYKSDGVTLDNVSLSQVSPDQINLFTYPDNYYTVVKNSGGQIIKIINNDHPINRDISLTTRCLNCTTYQQYTITVDLTNKTAIIERDSVIYDNGFTIVQKEGSDDITVDTSDQLNVTISPLYTELQTLKTFTLTFSGAVEKGPLYNTSYATIFRNDGSNYAVTLVALNTISLEESVTQFIITFENTITEEGDYSFYIPSGVFKGVDNQENLGYLNKRYSIRNDAEGDTLSYTLTPTEGVSITNFRIVFNKPIISITTSSTRGCFALYKKGLIEPALKFYGNTLVQYNENIVSLTPSKIITNSGLASSVEYYVGTYGTLQLITFQSGILLSAADYTTASKNFGTFTLLKPDVIELTNLGITGPDTISTISNFTYKPVFTPSNTSLTDVTWTLSENPYATIETQEDGSVILTTTSVPTEEIGEVPITLTVSNEASGKSATKTITVKYSSEPVKVVTGISIKNNNNSSIIDRAGLYTFTAVLTPSNTTLTSVVWSLESFDSSSIELTSSGLNASLNVKSLPTASLNIVLKATCENAEVATATYTLTVTNGIVPLESITIVGKSTIKTAGSYTYTAVLSPSNTSQKGITWTALSKSATITSAGVLTVTDLTEGTIIVQAKSTLNPNIFTNKTITIVNPNDRPLTQIEVTALNISGTTLIQQIGAYPYTVSFTPANTEQKSIAWTISNGAYSGIYIDLNGLLNVQSLPTNDTTIKIKVISLDNPDVYKELPITLTAKGLEEEQEGIIYSITTNPTTGTITLLSEVTINFIGSGITSVQLQGFLSNISLTSTAVDFLKSNLTCKASVNFKQSGSTWSNTYVFGTTYESNGTYTLTIPEGLFIINGKYANRAYSVIYTIGSSGDTTPGADPSQDGENSDNGGVSVGGLFSYGNGTYCFRPSINGEVSDTIIVKQLYTETEWYLPTIFVNPNVYYLQNGNFNVSEGEASIAYTYTNLSGYHEETLDITYGVSYNLTKNILSTIADLRDVTVAVSIKANNFNFYKKVKFVFVDPTAYSLLLINLDYKISNVQVDSSTYEILVPVYGCSVLTGYEVIVKSDYTEEGIRLKQCELSTNSKLRLGNLNNTYNEIFGKKLPHGYGLYSENVYLTGEFVLNNGTTMLDLSDGLTLIKGDISRAQALLEKTSENIRSLIASNFANMNNKIRNIFTLNLQLSSRIDNIANDGIISKDEKNELAHTWAQCVDNYFSILKIIEDLKEGDLRNDDADDEYETLDKANDEYKKAFFDINELIHDFILNEDTWDFDIYDKNENSNNPDIYTYLSASWRLNLYPTVIEETTYRDISYSTDATVFETLSDGETKIKLETYAKSLFLNSTKIFLTIYKDYLEQVNTINNAIRATLAAVTIAVSDRVKLIGLDGVISREEKADLALEWVTIQETFKSIILRLSNIYDLIHNPNNDYTIDISWDTLSSVEIIYGQNFYNLKGLFENLILADMTTDTYPEDIYNWILDLYSEVKTYDSIEDLKAGEVLESTEVAATAFVNMLVAYFTTQEIFVLLPFPTTFEDLCDASKNDYHFNNIWAAFFQSLEDILKILEKTGNDISLDLSSSIAGSIRNITSDNIITILEIDELRSDLAVVNKEYNLFKTKFLELVTDAKSSLDNPTEAMKSYSNQNMNVAWKMLDFVSDVLTEAYSTYSTYYFLFKSFADAAIILKNIITKEEFTSTLLSTDTSTNNKIPFRDVEDNEIPYSENIILAYYTEEDVLYQHHTSKTIADHIVKLSYYDVSVGQAVPPSEHKLTYLKNGDKHTVVIAIPKALNYGKVGGVGRITYDTKNLVIEVDNLYQLWDFYDEAKNALISAFNANLVTLYNTAIKCNSAVLSELVTAAMGLNLDIIVRNLLDYSLWALGSAGIAILNPNIMYTIDGKTLADYYDDCESHDNNPPIYENLAAAFNLYVSDLGDPSNHVIDYDASTVGDGDEELNLYGNKIRILTTETCYYIYRQSVKLYKVEIENFIQSHLLVGTSYGDTINATRQQVIDFLNKTENAPYYLKKDEYTYTGVFYIEETDLHKLRGNFNDYKVDQFLNSDSNDQQRCSSLTYGGTGNLPLYIKGDDGFGLFFGSYSSKSNDFSAEGSSSSDNYKIKVIIKYTVAALFENGYINLKLVRSSGLEVGTFDVNGNLDKTQAYARAYAYNKIDSDGKKLSKGTLEAFGAKINGSLVVGESEGQRIAIDAFTDIDNNLETSDDKKAEIRIYDAAGSLSTILSGRCGNVSEEALLSNNNSNAVIPITTNYREPEGDTTDINGVGTWLVNEKIVSDLRSYPYIDGSGKYMYELAVYDKHYSKKYTACYYNGTEKFEITLPCVLKFVLNSVNLKHPNVQMGFCHNNTIANNNYCYVPLYNFNNNGEKAYSYLKETIEVFAVSDTETISFYKKEINQQISSGTTSINNQDFIIEANPDKNLKFVVSTPGSYYIKVETTIDLCINFIYSIREDSNFNGDLNSYIQLSNNQFKLLVKMYCPFENINLTLASENYTSKYFSNGLVLSKNKGNYFIVNGSGDTVSTGIKCSNIGVAYTGDNSSYLYNGFRSPMMWPVAHLRFAQTGTTGIMFSHRRSFVKDISETSSIFIFGTEGEHTGYTDSKFTNTYFFDINNDWATAILNGSSDVDLFICLCSCRNIANGTMAACIEKGVKTSLRLKVICAIGGNYDVIIFKYFTPWGNEAAVQSETENENTD